MTRAKAGPAIVAWALAGAGLLAQTPSVPATRVVHFTPPATLPARVVTGGRCAMVSEMAPFRLDAYRCTAGTDTHDPCFAIGVPGPGTPPGPVTQVICDMDPRRAESGFVLTLSPPTPLGQGHETRATGGADPRPWCFELADGSLCQPLSGATRREVDGLPEIYSCRFASPGEADAVLGDLDASHPVWTIQQVLINKKIEPPTIKSTVVVTVKAVWQ